MNVQNFTCNTDTLQPFTAPFTKEMKGSRSS